MSPFTLDGIGWTLPLGAALIVVGIVLLALVDAPRRLLWRIRRFRGLDRPPPSGSRPDDGAIAPDAGTWVSPRAELSIDANVPSGGSEDAMWREPSPREAADGNRPTSADPVRAPASHQEPPEPRVDPTAPQERPSG